MVFHPSSAFVQGSAPKAAASPSDPVLPSELLAAPPTRPTEVPAFCMDRYEFPNQANAKPRMDVSWDEAQGLCKAQGKRLCQSAEFERACRGTEGRRYSYGDHFDRARCNVPIAEPKDGPPPIAKSGTLPNCHSPEGVFDLDGNLSEWVNDPWDTDRWPHEGLIEVDILEGVPKASLRTLRGSTLWSETAYGASCLSRHAHPRESLHDDDGFRCCAGPQ